jgi:hypothetical protein
VVGLVDEANILWGTCFIEELAMTMVAVVASFLVLLSFGFENSGGNGRQRFQEL